jgi:hypothetical protein
MIGSGFLRTHPKERSTKDQSVIQTFKLPYLRTNIVLRSRERECGAVGAMATAADSAGDGRQTSSSTELTDPWEYAK